MHVTDRTAPVPAPGDDAFSFSFETRLRVPAAEVWSHAMSIEGVNRELAPLVRMTAPAQRRKFELHEIELGRRVMRSWILAFGIVPVDYDDVTFVELDPGRRFLERSPMLTQRVWEHERVIEPAPHGCVVFDRVRFEPRVPWIGFVLLPVYRLVFANRHRRLAGLFGRA